MHIFLENKIFGYFKEMHIFLENKIFEYFNEISTLVIFLLKKGGVMRNIVVVEAISTGLNFVRDIANRNYYPIVLNPKVDETEDNQEYLEEVMAANESIDVDAICLDEKDTYEETLEMVRQYDPVIIVPGSERGVVLATKLSNDLGLKCNNIENIDAMTLKDKMQEKIAEAGLRHIRGRTVSSVEEAIAYYDEEGLDEVVVKPINSAGSVGVKICQNKEEMIDGLNEVFGSVNFYGDKLTEMVVQECIKGEEYVVNTVSCNGDHRVTTIWKHIKVKTEEGGQVVDTSITVNELGLGESELVEYAYDVVDAIGIRYGAVHGEYMIDDKGPVLIEVNCRPMGSKLDAVYADRISGQHETDSILDAYLNPDKFYFERDRGYRLYAHGCLKHFIVPRDIIAESYPMAHISNRLKSYYKSSQGIIEDAQLFVKTQDLETAGGVVYLVHEDGYVLQQDLDFLRTVEKRAFELVLSEDSDKKDFIDVDVSLDEIKSLLERVKGFGSQLFVTDQKLDGVDFLQVSPDEIGDVKGDFNCVVVNLNKSIADLKDDKISYLFLKVIDKVKVGGIIIIPESTYQYIPHGRAGAEALIKVLDLRIELPVHNLGKMVIASKR